MIKMPRIKGWRKIYQIKSPSGTEIRRDYQNRKSKTEIVIMTPTEGLCSVDIIDITGRRIGGRVFKTKKQALKYAKAWMKKHPEG